VAGSDAVDLRPAADRLTESLIRELSGLRALSVISSNGVAQFRSADVPRDSVARSLSVGTMVEGIIEPEGSDGVLITTSLYDGSGARLGNPKAIRVSRDSLFSAEASVAREVSTALRDALGPEIEIRDAQSGTRSIAAWNLFNRSERVRREAATFGTAQPDSARARLATADSLLVASQAADRRWVEPALQAIQVAYDRRRYVPAPEAGVTLDTALARVDAALSIDPSSAKALEWRGTIKYAKWLTGRLTLDPVARASLLKEAEDDLKAAIEKDDRLITAYATLSAVYYDKKDVPSALIQARTAYEADEFLTNSAAILSRLFYGSYDTQLFSDAEKWCDEGTSRFPRNYTFTLCHLWLQLPPDATPDVAKAWSLAARIDSLAPPEMRAFQSHLAQMIVGGVIGRYANSMSPGAQRSAMMDSAHRVLERAQGDRSVDPRQELAGYRAVMLAQFGEAAEAISLLTTYVAANPDHSFMVGGNVHWWWRDLRNQPAFSALLRRGSAQRTGGP
jgi:TolB-like protein/tetratricopeptide (TPR) repeat protein